MVDAVWGYARETGNGFDHVLRWMRVLHTLGAIEAMTAAQAQGYADQYTASRWDPVVAELTARQSAPDDYEPDRQVVDAVWGYARETGYGFDHVLRWMRVLHTVGAIEDMTAAEAQGYADSGWQRWVPVAAELARMAASTSDADPDPTAPPEPTPEPTPEPVGLHVAVTASSASPAMGTTIRLSAVISNPPAAADPEYEWEIAFGGVWYAYGNRPTLQYLAHKPETLAFRVTVSYDTGESVTSAPLAVAWFDPAVGPTPPSPNQAPVVNTQAARYRSFVGRSNAPRGTLVSKVFEGIFSDPDGDELTYTATVPATRSHLVDTLEIHRPVTSNGERTYLLFFIADAAADWHAVTPALPDPLTITATLTATDPYGLSASLSGDFVIAWSEDPLSNPPADLAAARLSATQLRLTWSGDYSARYEVQYRAINEADNTVGEWAQHATTGAGASQADIDGLSCRLSYDFRVRATRGDAAGPFATLSGVDTVLAGTAGADNLAGSAAGECVQGGDGNDVIYGNQGNDLLRGGDGDDVIYGGDGSDSGRGATGRRSSAAPPAPRGVSTAGGGLRPLNLDLGALPVHLMNRGGLGAVGARDDGAPQPPTIIKLVGNTGSAGAETAHNLDGAQGFSTGSSTYGYKLTRVDLLLKSATSPADNPTFTAHVWSSNSSNEPDSKVGDLTQQGSLPSALGKVQFTASGGGIDLEPGTTYFVVMDVTASPSGNDAKVGATSTDGEDADGAAGWGIADDSLNRSFSSTGAWTRDLTSLQISVHGYAKTLADDNLLTGGNDNDEIYGGRGNDTLHGGGGHDRLFGDSGNDELNGDAGNDTLGGGVGDDELNGGDGNDYLNGDDGNDVLRGGAGDDKLYGEHFGEGDDEIHGGPGHDVLWGGPGADKLYGGSPHATPTDGSTPLTASAYGDPNLNWYRSVSEWKLPGDTASYYWSTRGVTVNLNTGEASGGYAEGDTFNDIENLVGSWHDDTLTGYSGNHTLIRGGRGADTLDGGGNAGTYHKAADYRDSHDGVTITLHAETHQWGWGRGGSAQGDRLRNFNAVHGSNHDDTINGGDLAETLYGEGGDGYAHYGDTVDYSAFNNAASGGLIVTLPTVVIGLQGYQGIVTETADGSIVTRDPIGFSAPVTLRSIEHVTGSRHDDVINGNALSNTLNGGNGDDTLTGGDGWNTLNGGSGSDTVDYATEGQAVTVNLADGTASGNDFRDTLVSIENVTGSPHDDVFIASAAVNVIDGGGGMDTVYYQGRANSVTVALNDDGAVAVSRGHAHRDTLIGIARVLGPAVRGVIKGTPGDDQGDCAVTGTAGNDVLCGLAGNDILDGGDGDDKLVGGPGADRLIGGPGFDTAYYEGEPGTVTVGRDADGRLIVSGGDGEGDVLVGIEHVDGPAAGGYVPGTSNNDTLTGSPNNDRIEGFGGDDTLNGLAGDDSLGGGAGADALNGGDGIDTADYASSDAGVTVDLTAGTGTGGHAQGDTLANIENLTGTPFDDTLIGNAAANHIRGLAGNDLLEGRAAADTLDGGAGIDTASYAGSGAEVTASLADPASNTGDAQGDTYTSIENLTGSAHDDTLYGDAANNTISGGAGADALYGGVGVDLSQPAMLPGSNTGQPRRGHYDLAKDLGLFFGTGDNPLGYALTSVQTDMQVSAGNDPTYTAAIYDESNNQLVGTLTSPASLTNGLNTFTSDGIRLDPGTWYYVALVVSTDGASNPWVRTASTNDEDAAGLAGWAIGNAVSQKDRGTNDWRYNAGQGPAKIAVHGHVVPNDGSDGSDTADYTNSDAAVTVDLSSTGAQSGGHTEGDTLASIENVTGSPHDDILTGNALANVLRGGAGTDEFYFYEGFGADTISDYTLGATEAASEKIYVCMGTASNPPTRSASDDTGSDYIMTFTFNGAETGTITLKGITSSSTNFSNLNVQTLPVDSDGNCVDSEAEALQVWFVENTPNLTDGRIFMKVTTNKGGSAICKIHDGSSDNSIPCPPGTLISLPTSATRGNKVPVWANATFNSETATSSRHELVIDGPKVTPRVWASGGNGKLLVGWQAATGAGIGAINAHVVERRQQNADKTWPSSWTSEVKADTDREHTFTGLANGTWQVRARNNANDMDNSTHILGTTSEILTVVLAAANTNTPGTPTSAGVARGSGTLTVTWQPPDPETGALVYGYTVRHKVSGADDSTYVETTVHPRRVGTVCAGTVCSNPREVTITGLTTGTNYVVGIKSLNVNGASGWFTIGTTHAPQSNVGRMSANPRSNAGRMSAAGVGVTGTTQAVVTMRLLQRSSGGQGRAGIAGSSDAVGSDPDRVAPERSPSDGQRGRESEGAVSDAVVTPVVLRGTSGDDDLVGGPGDDELYGWTGDDTYTGGAVDDRFVFSPLSNGDKIITDFDDHDQIVLSSARFGLWPGVADILASEREEPAGYFVYTLIDGLTVETDIPLAAGDFAVEPESY